MITFDEFAKVEMRVGKVMAAEKVEGSEKLLRLEVDFNEEERRQVVSGIAKTFTEPEVLVGESFLFVTNLEPREIMGLESQAMIVAAKKEDGEIVLMEPSSEVEPGAKLS